MQQSEIGMEKTEGIALEVIRVLYGQFENFPEDSADNRNAPFHEAFLRAFADKIDTKAERDIPYFISVNSQLHGLNTTLEQTFLENVVHILSDGEKREFSHSKRTGLVITSAQREIISTIVSDLENNNRTPNTKLEDAALKQASNSGKSIEVQDFTVDNFVEGDTFVEAIELKTVRPNAGQMQSEKGKILSAKAALRKKYPNKKVSYYFGFPFDPWNASPAGFDKTRFLSRVIEGSKFLDQSEVLLANELWDRLSGKTNTMHQILNIINIIATPDFMEDYRFVADPTNLFKDKQRYTRLVDIWGLVREKQIILDIDRIRAKGKSNRKVERAINNSVFKAGEYNTRRYVALTQE